VPGVIFIHYLANRTKVLYNHRMNQTLFSNSAAGGISLPLGRSMLLVVAPHAAAPLMLELAARLSTAGVVRVLDGGNRFNVYPVSQGIRRLTGNVYPCLERISLARAFTCYQMLALLEETPAIDAPTLLLDFLATFNDESVPLPESLRLLEVCLPHFRRLSARAPLVISAKPVPSVTPERAALLERLQEVADQHWELEPARPVRMQPTLWEGIS
jgi:hypothetical protein